MIENNNEEKFNRQTTPYTHYVGVSFLNSTRAYNFGITDFVIKQGDKVVVETVRGLELGTAINDPVSIDNYHSELGLKPVKRKATDIDIKIYENNLKEAKFAMEICKNEVNILKLDMNLLLCEYTLDRTKIIFSYVADERVDFRELLKVLASKLHARIELRQIGSRDKAKMVGGIGVCGLPLCCSTFLSEFDGISINRAKNQMLAINIPKLSGHCGKLLCCLKYEDDVYTELKTQFPDIGRKVFIDKIQYIVTAINVISGTVKLDSEDDVKMLSLEEFKNQTHFVPRKEKNENH